MMKKSFVALFLLISSIGFAQTLPIVEDSIISGQLGEVVVRAYEQNKRLRDVPAPVSYFNQSSLNRFNNTTILSALNIAPGIRMEERSPGSYRLNIRGSSQRAPFGVRNVKVYYNNIPLTDPGGQTYLNQLGFYNFQSIEVIKGPGSSLYGSGNGGAMLIESTTPSFTPGVQLDYTMGSYNLQNVATAVRFGTNDFQNTVTYQHQTSDGYRQHTNMRRDVFSWTTKLKTSLKNELTASILYGDLFYQTPGPLNTTEYLNTPTIARPRVGVTPGSVDNRAAIYQQTFLAGMSNKFSISNLWSNTSTIYGTISQVKNPTIRNYGRNSEPHFGGRTLFQYQQSFSKSTLSWHFGAELQQGFLVSRIFNNKGGNPDSLQTDDELNNRQSFAFSQLSFETGAWTITAGASLNQLRVKATRFSSFPVVEKIRKYNNELAPRLAIMRKITGAINLYGSVSKGFSPPTTAEVLPSSGVLNTDLNAEDGNNFELGTKGNLLKGQLYFDVNAYLFRLKNTIVQRRDATGGDYFLNAGSTNQKGLESLITYKAATNAGSFIGPLRVWLSHTWNVFRYKDFKQLTTDFSGNQLPGTARHTVGGGLDLNFRPGIYLNATYLYSDPMPLNDANTAFANSYNLVGTRLGLKKKVGKLQLDIFSGVENLFDLKYSLGNDLNGIGGRFYNTAAGRNYFAGVSLQSAFK